MEVIVGDSEWVQRTVIYKEHDRVTGTAAATTLRILLERQEVSSKGTIMIFRLPPNDRNVKYVAYNAQWIEVLDGSAPHL